MSTVTSKTNRKVPTQCPANCFPFLLNTSEARSLLHQARGVFDSNHYDLRKRSWIFRVCECLLLEELASASKSVSEPEDALRWREPASPSCSKETFSKMFVGSRRKVRKKKMFHCVKKLGGSICLAPTVKEATVQRLDRFEINFKRSTKKVARHGKRIPSSSRTEHNGLSCVFFSCVLLHAGYARSSTCSDAGGLELPNKSRTTLPMSAVNRCLAYPPVCMHSSGEIVCQRECEPTSSTEATIRVVSTPVQNGGLSTTTPGKHAFTDHNISNMCSSGRCTCRFCYLVISDGTSAVNALCLSHLVPFDPENIPRKQRINTTWI